MHIYEDIKLTDEDIYDAEIDPKYRRAPKRQFNLTKNEIHLSIKNALRYIDPKHHTRFAKEFLYELKTHGRIYGYAFRPPGRIYAKEINQYEGNCIEGKAIQVMMDNNLDFEIALYPYELVTYGESGQVCSNWMQYALIKKYLQRLTNKQTLSIMSGHPLGIFHSNETSPRVIITNGLMVGMFDNLKDFNRAASLGVANYGQMTAGGLMYIGPQGIVHGTYNTLLNAGRLFLNVPKENDLLGKLFVTSGLGGMSGAQGKACTIARGTSIIAEVDLSRIETRHSQGWVDEISYSPEDAFEKAKYSLENEKPVSIAYFGNIVTLLEYADKNNIKIDLLSDQTSCHEPYTGGYCPSSISFEERTKLLKNDPEAFVNLVNETLKKHFEVIKSLCNKGTYFFDYGNSFMKAVFDSGVKEIAKNGIDERDAFIFPSYVEDILGPELFDYGFGPFRWVCLSGSEKDLDITDSAAMNSIDYNKSYQDLDNYKWIKDAKKNNLVVGSKARILYQDAEGRLKIALKFNELVRDGIVGPIMLGRDHHDVSGTDSPFRETSNIKDGSNIMADMATQCFAGNAARGMSMIALHNGGGVGIGKSINGGFGMVLDGSKRVDNILKDSMLWDVMSGVARRAWATNPNSIKTAKTYNQNYNSTDHITLPNIALDDIILEAMEENDNE